MKSNENKRRVGQKDRPRIPDTVFVALITAGGMIITAGIARDGAIEAAKINAAALGRNSLHQISVAGPSSRDDVCDER